jgi:hypothetical protein
MDQHDKWLAIQAAGAPPATPDEADDLPVMPPDLYTDATQRYPYGWDLSNPQQISVADESYKLAGGYLSGKGLVEDWGCGTTWARQYIHAPYRGIDGAWSRWTDEIVDLRTYTSSVPKILIRHVLEHNWDWRIVLNNALQSFNDRMMLILFLRPGLEDKNIYRNSHDPHKHIPAIALSEPDLHSILDGAGVTWHQEEVATKIESGYERVYFIEKWTGPRIPSGF